MENQATVTNNPHFLAVPQVRGSLGESLQKETRDYRQPYADLFAGTALIHLGVGTNLTRPAMSNSLTLPSMCVPCGMALSPEARGTTTSCLGSSMSSEV